MKKMYLIVLFLFSKNVITQTEKSDFLTFTPPANWTRNTPHNTITYEDKRNPNLQYAFVQVHKSLASSGNPQANFEHFWKELITATYKQNPPKPEITSKNGWTILTGKSQVLYAGIGYTAILQVFNNHEKTLPIFILYDKDTYQNEIDRFLANIQVPQTAPNANETQTNPNLPYSTTTSSKIKITYPKTNFDDGWVSVLENDFVRTSKGNLEIRIYYPDKEVVDSYSNASGKTLEQYLLEIYLGKEYNFQQFFLRRKEAFSYGESDIFEANATEKNSGRSVYLALTTYWESGVCQPIVAIAPSKEALYAVFSNYQTMEAMLAYNKFAVGNNELLGGRYLDK